MNVHIDTLIAIVVREVAAELQRRGIAVDGLSPDAHAHASGVSAPATRLVLDLSMYKTPVLTERHLLSLDESIGEIGIPKGTVITPGARDIIKRRSLSVSSEWTQQ